MKNFTKMFTAIILAMACFFSVACGGGEPSTKVYDVNSNEFYSNLVDKILDVEAFSFSAERFDKDVNSWVLDDENKGWNVFISYEEDNIYSVKSSRLAPSMEYFDIFYEGKIYGITKYTLGDRNRYYIQDEQHIYSQRENSILNTLNEFQNWMIALKANKENDLIDFVKKSINILFTASKTEDGYQIALDANKIKAVSADLKNLKVKEFIDKYYGENSFQSLKDNINALLDKTINQLKADINGITNDKFDVLLENLVNLVFKAQFNQNSVAKTEIENFITLYGDKKLSELKVVPSDEQSSLNNYVGALFGMCETSNLYEIIGIKPLENLDGKIIIGQGEYGFEDNSGNIIYSEGIVTLESVAFSLDSTGEVLDLQVVLETSEVNADLSQLNSRSRVVFKIEFNKEYDLNVLEEQIAEIKANYEAGKE